MIWKVEVRVEEALGARCSRELEVIVESSAGEKM